MVCLPGLSRTAADFGPLAGALSSRGRRVLALDYRGRGLSDHDPDWRNYSLPIENRDILTVLDEAGVERAVIVGTSRGGLHAMLLSQTRPSLIAGVALNDIGPVIEAAGMARIRGYVGKFAPPTTEDSAVALLKQTMGQTFTGLSEADWRSYARLTFADEAGGYGLRYDPDLAKATESFDAEKAAPAFWRWFDGLAACPLLIIRGAESDLFSASTLDEMARRHPGGETWIVEGQGHPPLLIDAPTIQRIASFVEGVENRQASGK